MGTFEGVTKDGGDKNVPLPPSSMDLKSDKIKKLFSFPGAVVNSYVAETTRFWKYSVPVSTPDDDFYQFMKLDWLRHSFGLAQEKRYLRAVRGDGITVTELNSIPNNDTTLSL